MATDQATVTVAASPTALEVTSDTATSPASGTFVGTQSLSDASTLAVAATTSAAAEGAVDAATNGATASYAASTWTQIDGATSAASASFPFGPGDQTLAETTTDTLAASFAGSDQVVTDLGTVAGNVLLVGVDAIAETMTVSASALFAGTGGFIDGGVNAAFAAITGWDAVTGVAILPTATASLSIAKPYAIVEIERDARELQIVDL